MNGLPYYKAYPRDFIEGTIGMPFEIKCAYRVVLDIMYMQGGFLPDDARYISGLLGCSIRKWKSIRSALVDAGKVEVSDEFLTNYRVVSELESLAKLQDKQRENRARPNKNNDLQSPRFDHTEPDTRKEPSNEGSKSAVRLPAGFDDFWDLYPNKVGKQAAVKAFAKARQSVSFEDLMTGLRRYVAKTDDRPWCNPTTWLNQGRWDDAPAGQPARASPDRPQSPAQFLRQQRLNREAEAHEGDDRRPERDCPAGSVVEFLPPPERGQPGSDDDSIWDRPPTVQRETG